MEAENRWAIKGCSGEGTRGLKVQIQAISECIRTNLQACSMAFSPSNSSNVCMLSILFMCVLMCECQHMCVLI